jgi:hypothetical protein
MAVSYFEQVMLSWAFSNPDLGLQGISSVLACTVLCSQLECATVNVQPEHAGASCQMSKKKGTCMEKEETYRSPGSRMYQRKVTVCLLQYDHVMSVLNIQYLPHLIASPSQQESCT